MTGEAQAPAGRFAQLLTTKADTLEHLSSFAVVVQRRWSDATEYHQGAVSTRSGHPPLSVLTTFVSFLVDLLVVGSAQLLIAVLVLVLLCCAYRCRHGLGPDGLPDSAVRTRRCTNDPLRSRPAGRRHHISGSVYASSSHHPGARTSRAAPAQRSLARLGLALDRSAAVAENCRYRCGHRTQARQR